MKLHLAFLALILGTAPVWAAEPPVTKGEMLAALGRCETSLHKVLKMPPPKARKGSSAPATRAEVLKEFNRVFAEVEPHFKVTPCPSLVDTAAIAKRNPAKQRPTIAKLVRWGCVAPVGPLVVGPGETLTVEQYGDALGFFFTRVTGLTHMPSQRWTPYLQPPDLDVTKPVIPSKPGNIQ